MGIKNGFFISDDECEYNEKNHMDEISEKYSKRIEHLSEKEKIKYENDVKELIANYTCTRMWCKCEDDDCRDVQYYKLRKDLDKKYNVNF